MSVIKDKFKKLKFLCLHGRRTSCEILRMQTAALRAYTQIDCTFIDAPFPAEGEPDVGLIFKLYFIL